jgi:CRISPR type III-A-associated RAMP protein Csm5
MIDKQEPLLDYLKKRKSGLSLKDVSKYTMPLYASEYSKTRSLKEQLRNGTGNPYIPGSSIKGAIRTAILNSSLNQLIHSWKEHELKDRREKFSDKKVQARVFGRDPNHDFMRFLKTGDAQFSIDSLIVLSILSLNYRKSKTVRDEKLLQLTEAIDSDFEATFRLKLDLDLWQKNIEFNEISKKIPEEMKSLTSLFKALNKFTAGLLESEIKFWKRDLHISVIEEYTDDCRYLLDDCKKCKENEAVLRLGHGSGWLFMTGGWVDNPRLISDDLYEKIINQTRPQNFRYKDYFFPKTRRMDEEGELMGFVKLTINN